MTEEKEQTTPEQEPDRVEQDQTKAAQSAVIEEQASIEKTESATHAAGSATENSETDETLLLDKPEEPLMLDKPEDPLLLDKPEEPMLLDKPEEPMLLEAQAQQSEEKPVEEKAREQVKEQVKGSLDKAKTNRNKPNKKKKSRKDMAQYNQMVSHFAACGRCSYFLAGYRVIHGVEELETAVFNSKAGWLTLAWNDDTRKLLTKSYGIELFSDTYHFDGCCPECGRHYTFQVGNAKRAASLRVQISSKRRK